VAQRFNAAIKRFSSVQALQFAENSSFDFVLKGRGFKPRRKCLKINLALAAEGALSLQCSLFHNL
jgi:hypothetical protein